MYSFEGNRVIAHTGTEYPIFQAPIGLVARAEVVSAVSAAGGVGLLETASLGRAEMEQQFDQVRARSNRPVGVHLMISILSRRPEQEALALDFALDGRTRFITTGYGEPERYIARIKDAGAYTYHHCETIEEALRAEDAGVDGVVLAGAEKGGGNDPDYLHIFTLLQKARRRLSIPIVAAGGIADGYGMAGAFALGAEGVWMGSRFITSAESLWHPNYKQAIVDAEEVIGVEIGVPTIPVMRAARTPFAEAAQRGEAGHKQNPYAGDVMKLIYEGRIDQALVGCGESGVLIDAVKPAGDIVRDTVREFWEEIERLADLRQPLRSRTPA